MKCDMKITDSEFGNVTCSVLGETQGAAWVTENRDKLLEPKECDAVLIRKKRLFGENVFFRCHVMGKFRVNQHAEDLEVKIRQAHEL